MKKSLFKIFLVVFLVSLPFISETGSYFFDTVISSNNTFATACWVAPTAPSLSSPANDTNTNANDVNFNWLATTSTCPIATISYSFQLDNANDFASPLINTPFSGNLSYAYNSIPQKEYWWRVQAKDQFDDTSTSSVYHLIVDRVAPIPSLSISGSWTKVVNEKITNGGFETGNLNGWTTAGNNVQVMNSDTISSPGTTITPPDGSWMVRIGNPEDPGNYIWENRLMQSFDGWPKSFSLSYNFFSRDYISHDQPGFFIRINGQEVFKLNNLGSDGTTALNTNWQQFYYDLSNHTNSKVNLAIYAGNTGDTSSQSWVYVDKITTYFISAPTHAAYNIFSADPFTAGTTASGTDYCEYKIDDHDWVHGFSFSIAEGGPHALLYHCVDRAGNSSPIYTVNVITDNQAPSTPSGFTVDSIATNSATLKWTAPGNDGITGRASKYDIRYSTSAITNASLFNLATIVDKVPSPQKSGLEESLELLGLNPSTTYYFAIKAADEAPNWSGMATTSGTTTAFAPETTVNAGDIVINELMWMGSNTDSGDEWIEIRNLTDREIDLSGFTLERPGSPDILMFTFPAGAKLKPKNDINKDDYLVVAEFDKDHSSLKNDPDYVIGAGDTDSSDFSLSNSTLKVYLYDNLDNLIDEAWNNTEPKEGYYEVASKYYSMERTSVPGDGLEPLNWYTCIDADSTALYFDGGADERGTPGAANRSENEPLAHQSFLTRAPSPTPLPTVTPQPKIILNISNDNKTASFTINNLTNYIKLSYELTYDSDAGTQGIIGETDLDNQDEYTKENITLGTCSTDGTCVYHSDINNIQLKISLEDKNHNTYSLTQLID